MPSNDSSASGRSWLSGRQDLASEGTYPRSGKKKDAMQLRTSKWRKNCTGLTTKWSGVLPLLSWPSSGFASDFLRGFAGFAYSSS
jgi:hypothetical protein